MLSLASINHFQHQVCHRSPFVRVVYGSVKLTVPGCVLQQFVNTDKQSARARSPQQPNRCQEVLDLNMASAGKSKAAVTMTVNDILSDLDRMPLQKDGPFSSVSTSTPYTRQPLPETSESVDTSIELSQRFIESSKRVLQDTDALDSVRVELERVDRLLDEVEQGVRS